MDSTGRRGCWCGDQGGCRDLRQFTRSTVYACTSELTYEANILACKIEQRILPFERSAQRESFKGGIVHGEDLPQH